MVKIIGVAGSINGCGCTHVCFSIAAALRKSRVCMLDRSGRDSFRLFGEESGIIDETDRGDYFEYNGIDFYIKDYELSSFKDYEYVVVDYGTDTGEEYCRSDINVLVVPSRRWNRGCKAVYASCEGIERNIGLANVTVVAPFADKEARKELAKVFSVTDILFTGYEDNPFDSKLDVQAILDHERVAVVRHEHVPTPVNNNTEETHKDTDDKPTEEPKAQAEDVLRLMQDWMKMQMQAAPAPAAPVVQDTDELTGLCTRRSFKKAVTEADELGSGYAIIFFDVNNLKKTNDNLGHAKGDILITTIAREIKERFPKLYRMGGDEFNAIVPMSEFSARTLDELDGALAELTAARNDEIIYEVAHGYALSTEALTVSEIMSLADKRMYEDKQRKKAARNPSVAVIGKEEGESQAPAETEVPEKANVPEPSFPLESVIAGTLPFGEDEPFRKTLDTMWFTNIRLAFEHTRYLEAKLWVFATEYAKPPMPVRCIAVAEFNDEYVLAYGKNNILRLGNSVFMVTARFTSEGRLAASVIPQNDEIKIESRSDIDNIGRYTPKHFGLKLNDCELYPIKQNIDGLCDCIVLQDDDVYLSNGSIVSNNQKYIIVLEQDRLELIPAIGK